MYMNLPFYEGDIIKNYKEMCKVLDEKVRTGGARNNQLKRWKKYFSWEKKGNSFIIKEIVDKKYPAHDDNKIGVNIKKRESFTLLRDKYKFSDELYSFVYITTHKRLSTILNLTEESLVNATLIEINYCWFISRSGLTMLERGLLSQKIESIEQEKLTQELLEKINKLYENKSVIQFRKKYIKKKRTKKSNYVYRFLNNKNQVIYVGKTISLNDRIYSHFSKITHLPDECYNNTTRIQYIEFESELYMNMAELYFISKFYPKYNSMSKCKDFQHIKDLDELYWRDYWRKEDDV